MEISEQFSEVESSLENKFPVFYIIKWSQYVRDPQEQTLQS